MEKIQHWKEAQKTENKLEEVMEQSAEQLQRKEFIISPQGILHYVEDDRWMMVVPKVLRQKIIQKNHDVPSIEHVGLNWKVDHIKRAF